MFNHKWVAIAESLEVNLGILLGFVKCGYSDHFKKTRGILVNAKPVCRGYSGLFL